MPDTQDILTPEDTDALIHAQQQLFAANDPRAAKVYNFIVQQGYATKGPQGELIRSNQASLAPAPTLAQRWANFVQHPLNEAESESSLTSRPSGASVPEMIGSDVGNVAAGAGQVARHPLQTIGNVLSSGLGVRPMVESAENAIVTGAGRPAPNPNTQLVPNSPEQASYALGQGLATAGALKAVPFATRAGSHVGDVMSELADQPTIAPRIPSTGVSGASDAGAIPDLPQGQGFPANVYAKAQAAGAKLFPSFVDGPPEDLMTRAVKPGKNNVQWDQSVKQAVPFMKSAEADLGRPIANFEDAVEANKIAKQKLWDQYQARLGPAAQSGAMIDGNQIANAMVNSLDERTALQNPQLAEKVQATADTYRRPLPLDQAEDFLQSANRDLITYYAKNKVSQQVAAGDPQMAATVAEGDALRNALYGKLDDLTGPGSAQLKKAYGALTNVQKELTGRAIVWARQNPVSLGEQVSTARNIGTMAKGVITLPIRPLGALGDIYGGAQSIAAQKLMSSLNDADGMIARAFKKASPATPFPQPTFRPPISAASRMLPADSTTGSKFPMLSPDPGMSAGEKSAALLHYWRQRQQLQLPANVNAYPIQLPAPQ